MRPTDTTGCRWASPCLDLVSRIQGETHIMSKIAVVIGLVLLTCGSSYASSISWGGISLSDNNGLAFLNGYSITTTPTSFILNLPNFSQSDFAFFSGEVDVAVTATDSSPDI